MASNSFRLQILPGISRQLDDSKDSRGEGDTPAIHIHHSGFRATANSALTEADEIENALD
jgi:hypothetical protein